MFAPLFILWKQGKVENRRILQDMLSVQFSKRHTEYQAQRATLFSFPPPK